VAAADRAITFVQRFGGLVNSNVYFHLRFSAEHPRVPGRAESGGARNARSLFFKDDREPKLVDRSDCEPGTPDWWLSLGDPREHGG
jgi:hypothetical protein